MRKTKRTSDFKNAIIKYMTNNSKEYILTILIFVIGLFLGVMFINNCTEAQETEIISYISEFMQKFHDIDKIDKGSLIESSMRSNIILAVVIWLAGTTIVGIPVVLGIILFRGFCLGYTISAISFTVGAKKSIMFCIFSLFLQNIVFIPALLTMGVSSIKLYKAIITDRRKDTIKVEIIRHTIVCLIMLAFLALSSWIENQISVSLLQFIIKYI